jgi:hypothetical protein
MKLIKRFLNFFAPYQVESYDGGEIFGVHTCWTIHRSYSWVRMYPIWANVAIRYRWTGQVIAYRFQG